ncbi:hypothetical protein [Butyrivibrio sp. AE2032]|uniref:hypothetical protein n=1 Tax=Butyrivibrio sp. AE2032 TaxID=1458463 RepID=UPI00055190A6|nr:hypothetical protein [Butyrivibrio sp. AE2032]
MWEGDGKMLYSFDVFDTVITRKTVRPDGIFAFMQDVVINDETFSTIPKYLKDNFFDIRRDTERFIRELYKTNGIQEIHIEEIYGKIKQLWQLSDATVKKLIELEIKTELENVLPIKRTIDKIMDLINEGGMVIFISDMYLSETTIRNMLEKADNRLNDIPLYVSCEYGKTKVSGDLYKMVGDIYKVNYDEWIHEGDNQFSDIEVPEKMGIHVCERRYKKMLPIEGFVYQAHRRNYLAQVIIGAGVNARLFEKENCSDAFNYGTALLLPIISSYSSFILEQCDFRGIDELFFIARDGYLIKYAVDKMIRVRGRDIKTHYIYGSREAWRIPALSEDYWNIDLLGARSRGTKDARIEDFASVFGMTYEELYDFLPEKYWNRKILRPSEKIELADLLQNDHKFKEFILKKNARNRELAKKYLKQEIKSDSRKFAFVEFIGGGNTQTALAELLGDEYTPMTTFYFSTTGEFSNDKCVFHQCYPVSISAVWQYEMFFVAPHGRTVGYSEKEDGEVVPVLNDEYKTLREYGMDDFAKGFEDAFDNLDPFINAPLYLCLDYSAYMWNIGEGRLCDDDLLGFYGNMPYGISGREEELPKYGGKLTHEDFMRLYAIRTFENLKLFYNDCNYAVSREQMSTEDFEYIEQCRAKMFDEEIVQIRRNFWKKIGTPKDRIAMLGIPVDKIGKKVAVYGAGKYGRSLIEALDEYPDIDIAIWVDKKMQGTVIYEHMIKPVEDIFSSEYDQIIIGIIKEELANEVENYLVEQGVPSTLIVKAKKD